MAGPIQFQTINESDFGAGIDQQSAENKVQPGHVESLVNMDPQSNGQLNRRKGSQSHIGPVPFRVHSIKQTPDNKLTVTLAGGIDLSEVASVPLVLTGSSTIPEFAGAGTNWYTGFKADSRKKVAPLSTSTFVFTAAEHGQPYSNTLPILVDVFQSQDPLLNDNLRVYPDSTVLDFTTGELAITVTNQTEDELPLFFSFRSLQDPGIVYVSNQLVTSAATHGLVNTNLGIRTFFVSTTEIKELVPDAIQVSALGDVTVSVSQPASYLVAIIANPLANQATGQVPAESEHQIDLGALGQFNEVIVALDNGDGSKDLVFPDSIEYSVATGNTVVSFQNEGPARSFTCFWESRNLALNVLTLDSHTTTSTQIIDSLPQLVLFGLDHELVYASTAEERAGWVHHIDSYKAAGEQFLVAGLGGNFFKDSQTVHFLGYPNLRTRVTSRTFIGPAISDYATSRTRGNLITDAGGNGWITATRVSYDTSTGYSVYTCPLDSYTLTDGAILSGDVLTVTGGSFSRHNGSFVIGLVEFLSDSVVFYVSNPNMNSDYQDDGCAARVGVFADRIPVQSTNLTALDVLTSDAVSGLKVVANGGSFLIVDGTTESSELPAGLLLLGKRNTSRLSLRNSLGTPSVEGLVVGDMLTITGELIKTQIISIDTSTSSIEVDRAIAIQDSSANEQTISILGRWLPIESPNPAISTTGLDVNLHPITSSSMAGDNLYLTDGQSNVLKITGENVYDAGLPRWQVQAFLTMDEAPTVAPIGLIPVNLDLSYSQDSTSGAISTVLLTTPKQSVTYRYYYRLNSIDENDNLIASAVVGSNETYVQLTRPAQIRHKLIGLPPTIGLLNASRFEIEIYRTLPDLAAPFYKIATVPLADSQYVEFVDATPDTALSENDGIAINFTGIELPTALSDPLPARHITSLGNRTVFANLTGRPKVDLSFRGKETSLLSVSDFDQMELLLRKNNIDNAVSLDVNNRLSLRTTELFDKVVLTNDAGNVKITGLTHPLSIGDIVYLFKKKQDNVIVPTSGIVGDTLTKSAHGLINGQQVFLDSQPTAINPLLTTRQIGVAVTPYSVQVLTSNTFKLKNSSGSVISFTSSGTSGSLTVVPNPAPNLRYQGWHQVIGSNNSDSVTLNLAFSDSTEADVDTCASITDTIPVYIGPSDCGILEDAATNLVNAADSVLSRISKAINAVQHFATNPWVLASAGGDIEGPVLRTEFRNCQSAIPEIVIPDTTSTKYQVFGNGILRDANASVGAKKNIYPSRLVFSYPNFPDMVDDPEVESGSQSPNVIDVNSNDGQPITKVLPFFGTSSFGAAMKDTVLAVFKTNSIYLVNLAEKAAGRNPVQRIDSRGMGLDIEGSAAPTKDGIMFLNTSGAFRLTESLRLEYTGQRIERLFKKLGTKQSTLAFGHHSSLDQQWKCSVLLPGETRPDTALVYCHTRESEGNVQGRATMGAWTRYSGQDAIGWANLDSDEFRAGTKGQVAITLKTGTSVDFSDSGKAFPSRVLMAAKDFGDGGIRKLVSYCVVKYRQVGDMLNTVVTAATDMRDRFLELDNFSIDVKETTDGLSDINSVDKINTVRYSVPERKAVFIQLAIENNQLNEPLEITEVSYRVAALTDKGIGQAKKL
jgi:hypothetical protein